MTGWRSLPVLLLGFVVLAVLPLAVLSWLHLSALEVSQMQGVQRHLVSLADHKMRSIQQYLDERTDDAQMLAQLDAIRSQYVIRPDQSPTQGRRAALHGVLNQALDLGGYHDILLIDANGRVMFTLRQESDYNSNLNTGPYRESSLADAHREALKRHDVRISKVLPYGPSGNRPALFIVTPVLEQGRAVGTLALQLDSDRLTQVTGDRVGLGLSGETAVAQEDHGHALYVGPLMRVPNAAMRHRVPLDNVAQPMQQALSGVQGQGRVLDYSGIEVYAVWRYLPGPGWGMVVKIDMDEALAPVQRLRNHTLAVFVLILALAAASAVFIGRLLNLPLQQLVNAARRIAEGDLQKRAPMAGLREHRLLAESFNYMADRLLEEKERLEERVHERTLELNVSKGRFDDLVDSISVGVYVLRMRADGGVGFDYVSPQFARLLGLTVEAILSDGWVAFRRAHPDDLEDFIARNEAVRRTLEPFHWEGRFVINDQVRWLRIQSTATRQANGDSVWNGWMDDITEARLAQLAMAVN